MVFLLRFDAFKSFRDALLIIRNLPCARRMAGISLLVAGLGWCLPAAAVDQGLVAVDYRDGAYFGSLEMVVAVPPAVALAVLTDFDHMAEFMPGLYRSRILGRDGNVYRIAQQGRAQYGPVGFSYESERRIEVVDGKRILAQATAGTAKRMASEMQLHPVAGGTRLEYRVEIVSADWLPGVVGRGFFRHELAEQFSALEREMLRRLSRP